MSSAKVLPFALREPGDWMMGGSQDLDGKRLFGIGPQDVAEIAADSYLWLRGNSRPDIPRDVFVHALCLSVADAMCAKAGVPMLVAEGEDDAQP